MERQNEDLTRYKRVGLAAPTIAMEGLVAVTPAKGDTDVFVNKQPLWLPPGARGIYGGTLLGQSLSAAQKTVPHNLLPHHMHCQFIRAGKPGSPLRYQIARTSDGRTFATRQVTVLQDSVPIFLASISLCAQPSSPSTDSLTHSTPMPRGLPEPVDDLDSGSHPHAPYLNKKVGLIRGTDSAPYEKKVHHWYRANRELPSSEGAHTHVSALAYICDSYMVGLLPHIHEVWYFVSPPETEFDPGNPDLAASAQEHSRAPASGERGSWPLQGKVGMMVTINHSMYFHNPVDITVDEWMLAELRSDWAGNGRGIVSQKIWTREGKLLATALKR